MRDRRADAAWHGREIVFITAYDQYAIEAFEQGVVDYVLKPAERERLLVTVERLRKRIADARRRRGARRRAACSSCCRSSPTKIEPGRRADSCAGSRRRSARASR